MYRQSFSVASAFDEHHSNIGIGDKFGEILDNNLWNTGDKTRVPEKPSFQAAQLIFKEINRMFWIMAGGQVVA